MEVIQMSMQEISEKKVQEIKTIKALDNAESEQIATIMKKNYADCDDLKQDQQIVVKTNCMESLYWLIRHTGEEIDLEKRFRIILDYDPETFNATIKFFK